MTNAETLLSLAERVETASGADRCLDVEIAAILLGDLIPWRAFSAEGELDWIDRHTNRARYAPRYTASLDAAMSLIDWKWLSEQGFRFSLGQEIYDERWTARADTSGDECGNGETIMSGYCDDKVRATLSFALRAHASQSQEPSK